MTHATSFRAVLFRMVPKRRNVNGKDVKCFRAVLFRMVPKLHKFGYEVEKCFRAVLFRMVPKPSTDRKRQVFMF